MNSPEDDACTEIGPGIYLTPSLLLVIATTALSVSCDGVEIFISLAASSNSFFFEVSLLAILISLFVGLDRLFHRYSTHRYSRRVEYLWLFVNIDNRVNKVDYYIYRGVYVVKIFISGKISCCSLPRFVHPCLQDMQETLRFMHNSQRVAR